MPQSRPFIATHPQLGIYLGSCLGHSFWSLIDDIHGRGAPTFASIQDAHDHSEQLLDGWPLGTTWVQLAEAASCGVATPAQCQRAGLAQWLGLRTPTANLLPA